MAKMKSLTVRVSGKGRFPVDMLRYDNLVPGSEASSALIAGSLSEVTCNGLPFSVELKGWLNPGDGSFPSSVTPGRWESFNWKVDEIMVDGKRVSSIFAR